MYTALRKTCELSWKLQTRLQEMSYIKLSAKEQLCKHSAINQCRMRRVTGSEQVTLVSVIRVVHAFIYLLLFLTKLLRSVCLVLQVVLQRVSCYVLFIYLFFSCGKQATNMGYIKKLLCYKYIFYYTFKCNLTLGCTLLRRWSLNHSKHILSQFMWHEIMS